MPKYLVGTDHNYYGSQSLDFKPDFIVTADSPYSRPTSIEPFDAEDATSVQLAADTALWMDELPDDRANLWEIWTTKTVVTDLDGNIISWDRPTDQSAQPKVKSRRVANRG